MPTRARAPMVAALLVLAAAACCFPAAAARVAGASAAEFAHVRDAVHKYNALALRPASGGASLVTTQQLDANSGDEYSRCDSLYDVTQSEPWKCVECIADNGANGDMCPECCALISGENQMTVCKVGACCVRASLTKFGDSFVALEDYSASSAPSVDRCSGESRDADCRKCVYVFRQDDMAVVPCSSDTFTLPDRVDKFSGDVQCLEEDGESSSTEDTNDRAPTEPETESEEDNETTFDSDDDYGDEGLPVAAVAGGVGGAVGLLALLALGCGLSYCFGVCCFKDRGRDERTGGDNTSPPGVTVDSLYVSHDGQQSIGSDVVTPRQHLVRQQHQSPTAAPVGPATSGSFSQAQIPYTADGPIDSYSLGPPAAILPTNLGPTHPGSSGSQAGPQLHPTSTQRAAEAYSGLQQNWTSNAPQTGPVAGVASHGHSGHSHNPENQYGSIVSPDAHQPN